ncbi:UDP-N-acetylmuramoyl-tripeptide--D-alanyl-D-alanine ligase [Virgibacillus sp. W0181]|uniref:UDP-N-acetylmuramoyl-tripeptide--D-alanyl-D- alanine ligase n=1 Tax=Virgibacillus sp. W0181 TaxID=3391581 RepID=UPI003F466652
MLFHTNWLTKLFPTYKGNPHGYDSIAEVTTDSRLKSHKSLFIPLIGDHFDGHDHLEQAVNNGALAVIWDENKQLPSFLPADFPVFFTSNTLNALQKLAKAYRNEINPLVIGITGSNGKTTTKDIIASIMKTTYNTHATEGNFNNHIGLPLTILRMPRSTEVLVLEMGMNAFGEIEQLSKIACPDYAVITNIGESHIEYLGSRQGIAKAKLEITAGLKDTGHLILDGDEPLLSISNVHQQIRCGFEHNNDVRINIVGIDLEETVFELSNGEHYAISLLGDHHAKNSTYGIVLAEKLGISSSTIKDGLSKINITGMRFERLQGNNGTTIINDAYNASPTSMIAAIDVIKQTKGFNHKILVLGDIFELGDQSIALHQSVAPHIDEQITALFTYGEAAQEITKQVQQMNNHTKSIHFNSIGPLLEELKPLLNKDTIVLFKASRGMKFEKLIENVL